MAPDKKRNDDKSGAASPSTGSPCNCGSGSGQKRPVRDRKAKSGKKSLKVIRRHAYVRLSDGAGNLKIPLGQFRRKANNLGCQITPYNEICPPPDRRPGPPGSVVTLGDFLKIREDVKSARSKKGKSAKGKRGNPAKPNRPTLVDGSDEVRVRSDGGSRNSKPDRIDLRVIYSTGMTAEVTGVTLIEATQILISLDASRSVGNRSKP
jgi:hypothetical protein